MADTPGVPGLEHRDRSSKLAAYFLVVLRAAYQVSFIIIAWLPTIGIGPCGGGRLLPRGAHTPIVLTEGHDLKRAGIYRVIKLGGSPRNH